MRNLRRTFVSICILFLAIMVLCFVLENQQVVSLVFFGWAVPSLPVSVMVLLALVLGMVVGPLLALCLGGRGVRRRSGVGS